MIRAPERMETARLLLRRPVPDDLQAIFDRYASDPEVTRYFAWPTHRSLEDTRHFLAFSDAEWNRHPAGPYLVERDGRIIGSTGLTVHSHDEALAGYVLARDAWGQGYATECLFAMISLARDLGVRRLAAYCNPQNAASLRVLEKGGFVPSGEPVCCSGPMRGCAKFVLPGSVSES